MFLFESVQRVLFDALATHIHYRCKKSYVFFSPTTISVDVGKSYFLLPGDGGDSDSLLTGGVLVECNELDTAHLALRYTAGLLQRHTRNTQYSCRTKISAHTYIKFRAHIKPSL